MNAKMRTIGLLVALLGLMVARESWGQSQARRSAGAAPAATAESTVAETPSLTHPPTSGVNRNGLRVPTTEVLTPAMGMGGMGGGMGMEGGMGHGAGRMGMGGGTGGFGEGGMAYGRGVEPSYKQRIALLKSVLSGAETSDEEKSKAKQEIEALLNQYFDQDIETRQAQVAQIEQRVAKLKAQLQTRLAAKSELVQLQMKLIENEAAGLGFFGDPRQGIGEGRGGYGEEMYGGEGMFGTDPT